MIDLQDGVGRVNEHLEIDPTISFETLLQAMKENAGIRSWLAQAMIEARLEVQRLTEQKKFLKVSIVYATRTKMIETGVKFTEKALEGIYRIDEEYISVRDELIDVTYTHGRLENLVKDIDERAEMLRSIGTTMRFEHENNLRILTNEGSNKT